MNFIIFDLILLGLFLIFVSRFLYKKRKKLKREGWLWLYHTKWGVNLIKRTGEKYKKTLSILSYVSVFMGYILMILMIWMFARIVWLYLFNGDLVRAIKIPPIAPLIPYLPQIFKLSFLPPFYFSHWIIILSLIAISHEFFHGIFAARFKVKTTTTGFGFFPHFFPVFNAAFVSLDEEKMEKIKNFKQRAILSAGTFANVLTAILGVLLMWGFFTLSFSPAGVVYEDYAYEFVAPSEIISINGLNFTSSEDITETSPFTNITTTKGNFVALKHYYEKENQFLLYYKSPAIENNLTGAISKINGIEILNLGSLEKELKKYSPGEIIEIETINGDTKSNRIILGENPYTGEAWLGIVLKSPPTGIISKIISFATSYKDPNIYYKPDFEFAQYIYDLLWWLILISFSVALVNMLPMGIFDGGRFFYLTILSITGSKKAAENSFRIITALLLALVVLVMIFWAKSFF